MMAEEAQPTYESRTTTRRSSGLTLNTEYPKSIPGIIKISEIVLSIITFICSIVKGWDASGWVEFVSFTAFLTSLIYFILTLVNLFSFTTRFPGPWLLIEFIYCIIFTVFYLIAAFVAAAYAAHCSANVGVMAFFAFVATAVFIVDTVYQFRAWSTSDSSMRTQTTTTTTTIVNDDRPKY